MGQQDDAFAAADARFTPEELATEVVYLQLQSHANPKARKTLVFATAESAWDFVRARLAFAPDEGWCVRDVTICELLRCTRTHYLYFDIEYYTPAADPAEETARVDGICALIQDVVPGDTSLVRSRGTRAMPDGSTKVSWHVHCLGSYTLGTPRVYCDALFATESPLLVHSGTPVVDRAVYSRNRLFRTVFSKKPGGTPLVPEEPCATLDDCRLAFLRRILRGRDGTPYPLPLEPPRKKAAARARTVGACDIAVPAGAPDRLSAWLGDVSCMRTYGEFNLVPMTLRDPTVLRYRLVLTHAHKHRCAGGNEHNGGCGLNHYVEVHLATLLVYTRCWDNGRGLSCTRNLTLVGTVPLAEASAAAEVLAPRAPSSEILPVEPQTPHAP
jgi:hypothetical protein